MKMLHAHEHMGIKIRQTKTHSDLKTTIMSGKFRFTDYNVVFFFWSFLIHVLQKGNYPKRGGALEDVISYDTDS